MVACACSPKCSEGGGLEPTLAAVGWHQRPKLLQRSHPQRLGTDEMGSFIEKVDTKKRIIKVCSCVTFWILFCIS